MINQSVEESTVVLLEVIDYLLLLISPYVSRYIGSFQSGLTLSEFEWEEIVDMSTNNPLITNRSFIHITMRELFDYSIISPNFARDTPGNVVLADTSTLRSHSSCSQTCQMVSSSRAS